MSPSMASQDFCGCLEVLSSSHAASEIYRENQSSLVRVEHDKVSWTYDVTGNMNDSISMNESTLIDSSCENGPGCVSEKSAPRFDDTLSDAYLLPIPSHGITKVGRSETDCQLVVPSYYVSAVHFWVWCVKFNPDSPPFVYLSDMSRNGTFINGVKLGKGNIELLNGGDVIEVKQGFSCVFRDHEFATQYSDDDTSESVKTIPHSSGKGQWSITNRTLGKGSFGAVVVGKDAFTKKNVAVKCIMQNSILKHDKVKHEAEILRNIKHPNIIKFFDSQFIGNDYFIFQELICGGDLFSYLTRGNTITSIPENEALLIVFQILNALNFLHYHLQIIHRDLKLDNILLEAPVSGTRVVLCDFGIAKRLNKLNDRTKTIVGTIEFSAPEVFAGTVSTGKDSFVQNMKNPGYNYKCDTWSLGIITHIMLSGISPFMRSENESKFAIIERAKEGLLDLNSENWCKVSTAAKSFIACLLKVDHHERLDVKQCFKHAWIARKKNRLQKIYDSKIIRSRTGKQVR